MTVKKLGEKFQVIQTSRFKTIAEECTINTYTFANVVFGSKDRDQSAGSLV